MNYALVALALTLVTGCSQTALVKVSLPMDPLRGAEPRGGKLMNEGGAAGSPRGNPRVVLFAEAPISCSGFRWRDAGEIRKSLAGALSGTGRYEVIEPAAWPAETLTAAGARRIAREAGADALFWIEPDHLRIKRSLHHVHEYFDGSASGRVLVLQARSGLLLKTAGERVYLSTRARYSSEDYVRDLLLSRLAEKLSRSLLYQETRYFVELECPQPTARDPSPGFLRRGIDLASEGQWPAAIEEWEALLEHGDPARKAPALHYNLGIALALTGRREEALHHLRVALEADPGSPRYGKVFARVAAEGWPWESP